MLFGYRQFSDSTDTNICIDVDGVNNTANNCVVVSPDGFASYNLVAFRLWLVTFGRQFDRTVSSS